MPQTPEARKGMPPVKLDEPEFRKRFLIPYLDPVFDPLRGELDKIAGAAWDAYIDSRKSPITQKAGPGRADPDYDLAVDWIAAKAAIDEAQKQYDDPAGPGHVLLINGSSRSEHTCPGEMSKSYRMLEIAKAVLDAGGLESTVLNLSDLASEYGRQIHPCKACFSTAAALCHWPCSCYPNYSLGQAQDWMNDIYPLWVRAHGVLIVTPVNWYQATSPLKLMIDRLVCADGGNPDPSSTHGKTVEEAKALELAGWGYPRHLEGRVFGVISHGDTEGATGLRRNLSDWMSAMQMVPAGAAAELDRYIGYYEPYATSHEALDKDEAIQEEVRNVARALLEAVQAKRDGRLVVPGAGLKEPRPK